MRRISDTRRSARTFRLRSLWDLKVVRARFDDPGLQALVYERCAVAKPAKVGSQIIDSMLDYQITPYGLLVAHERFVENKSVRS